jgi:diadenosine tetraphosphate (Ap4A) HIT family hydrolase
MIKFRNMNRKENILKQIFFDENNNWERFQTENQKNIRSIVIKEVEKFKKCGEIESGFKLYACDYCGEVKIVPHRCKGRFCSVCATGFIQEWSKETAERMYDIEHRHIMFTMPEKMWEIFLKRRDLLKDMMDIAVEVLKEWFIKREKLEVGIMAGLHTFGARMEYNAHCHLLVTEGGLTKDGKLKQIGFIPYEMMRKRWKKKLMKMLSRKLSDRDKARYREVLKESEREYENGFVVVGPKTKGKDGNKSEKDRIAYIGRYVRRAAIALRRIKSYDGKVIVIKYFDKKEKKEKLEEIGVMEFIGRIIRHIPDKNFKTIRYYGIYSRRKKGKVDKILRVKGNKVKKQSWKEKITNWLGESPLKCTKCGLMEMEYKGEVSFKKGKLVIRYAKCNKARLFLEEMLGYESRRKKKVRKKEEIKKSIKRNSRWEGQICMFTM